MTQEHKDLLLKDLCARLPYGVKCENHNHVYGKNIFKVTDIRDNGYICGIINNRNYWAVFDPLELKPYLFPLSSMTEEQKVEFDKMAELDMEYTITQIKNDSLIWTSGLNRYNWLIKNHFDVYDLIPMGLANDATGLNIY
jgi:hypothetical protein